MDLKLARCARCKNLFNKIVSEVCNLCQPDEDQDFSRIQDVLAHVKGLNVEKVAEEAGVSVDCVLRMLREGRIDNVAHDDEASCGRCGAPAISTTKRLCKRCLVVLDRECAHAMQEMRQRIHAKNSSDMNDVTEAVEMRRASRRRQRQENERTAAPAPSTALARRMVVPEHLRKRPGKKP